MLFYNSLVILICTLLSVNIAEIAHNNDRSKDSNNIDDISGKIVQEQVKPIQKDDLFSSTSKLEELVDNELQVVELLDTLADFCLERVQIIKSYVENQKQLLMNGKENKDIVGHPVEAYLLVRRLTADWDDVHIALHGISNYSQSVYTWIDTYRENFNFPRADDLNGAAQAIVRLQDTYKLDMASLADGVLLPDPISNEISKEFHGTVGFNARDLLFLGNHAFKQGLYNRAIEWLQKAQDTASTDNTGSSTLLEQIKPSLKSAIEVHDDILERQGPSGGHWKTNPVPFNSLLAKSSKYRGTSKEKEFVPKLLQKQSEDEESEHYSRLCRGEKLRDPALEHNLKCRVKRSGHPYLTISPLKIEEESFDPYIVVIHDFITSNQCDQLIELGKPKLFRSKHRHHLNGGEDVASPKRISQNAWLKDWENPVLKGITSRVELATGLKASEPKEAEDYQIANYGLGGLYVPHTDNLMINPDPQAYTPWELFIGDRIATLMIYISDVNSGGATVFPRAGVTLWPKKGSAAFWWNMDKSGNADETTRHGACPVLHGSKWVSNKWIRHNEQFQTAKCGLRPDDKFKRP